MKNLLLLLSFLAAFSVKAQDTLWVKENDGQPCLFHKVKSGETLFMLGKRYSVPPAVLADVNGVNYQDGLAPGKKFIIPIDKYNYIRIESVVKSRPIYLKTTEDHDLRSISRMFNVPQSAIQRWNNMDNPDIIPGKVLLAGWIAYDKTEVPFHRPSSDSVITARPFKGDSLRSVRPSHLKTDTATALNDTLHTEQDEYEQLYEQQVGGGNVTEESGAAVFYPLKMNVAPGVYYALHNMASRGTILKISNPTNGKVIYAKVIGTMPRLKEYHNAVVGLSNNAISTLGATDRRMFCKVKYR